MPAKSNSTMKKTPAKKKVTPKTKKQGNTTKTSGKKQVMKRQGTKRATSPEPPSYVKRRSQKIPDQERKRLKTLRKEDLMTLATLAGEDNPILEELENGTRADAAHVIARNANYRNALYATGALGGVGVGGLIGYLYGRKKGNKATENDLSDSKLETEPKTKQQPDSDGEEED